MHQLVLDHLRRLWLRFLCVAGIMAAIWLSGLHGGLEPGWAFAGSMMLACMSGPMAVLLQFGIREFGVLPVSRRDVWRARWLEMTVIAAAVTATGKALTMAVAPFFWPGLSLRPDLLLLSTWVDISALGATTAVMAWLARRRTVAPGKLDNALDVLAMLTILLSPFVGLALRDVLPVDVESLRRLWWALLPGVASFVIIQWHYPATLRPATVIAVKPSSGRRSASSSPSRLRPSSVTAELARIVVFKASLPALFGFGLVVIDFLSTSDFAGDEGRILRNWMILAVIVACGDWRDRLRQLRLLPLSTATLIALMLAASTLAWFGLIAITATFHIWFPASVVAAPAMPWSLPLVAMSALSEAVSLRFAWGGRVLIGAAAITAGGIFRRSLDTLIASSPVLAPTIIGSMLMLVAVATFFYTLTRSSSAYRAPKSGLLFGHEVHQTR